MRRIETQRVNARQEMLVGITLPPWFHAGEKTPPGLMIFFRVQFVGLLDEDFAALLGLFDKRRPVRGQAGRLDKVSRSRHTQSP